MTRLLPRLLLLVPLFLLVSCSHQRLEDYAGTRPAFDLFAYFDGNTRGHGLVQETDGTLLRRFVVDITGTVTGDTLTLDEQFLYDDGERQQRVWTIRRVGPGEFRGTAADVVGEATGRVQGAALNWRYTLKLPARGRVWEIAFDDWMYLHNDRVLANTARFSKFGVDLGTVTLFFVRDPARPL